MKLTTLLPLVPLTQAASKDCPDYSSYSKNRNTPLSSGRYRLAYQRPPSNCRTFASPSVESLISNLTKTISDPDLTRLFENTFPNTLDTAIKWHGNSSFNPTEELTFIITGDIDAMWLRDSTNQLETYTSLLTSSSHELAPLFRGAINLQSRYILSDPYCNSFQPPSESGIPPAHNDASKTDRVFPHYSDVTVFECKYELDSLASFLQLSNSYYTATKDASFFGKHKWKETIQTILDTAKTMQRGTYADDGRVLDNGYMFNRETSRATETFSNDGAGEPVRSNGLIRSGFRPSDDATTLQFLVPANMMFAAHLGRAAGIMKRLDGQLAKQMVDLANEVRRAIEEFGIVRLKTGKAYAYEVDGYGGARAMDDANLPSLLAAPLMGFVKVDDPVYQHTRARILSGKGNPYFMEGPVINAVGSPHTGPGNAWPMGAVVAILTTSDDKEISARLKELVGSTDGLGLMHESINAHDSSRWTRQWFSWANGLFGEMIVDLARRKPHILKRSFQ
ncbi:hypothetical protein OQA88_1106 [Cercophora sp. LCS_1]